MANYIKSHSNYVLKKKHQDINSGTIYERDITTIGGLNQFSRGQVPIYKSSNFIITVNNEVVPSRNVGTSGWYTSPSGDDIWTLEDVSIVSGNVKESCEVVLKQDYYSLKDFAYYGSCVELIRASINNIALNFPGSLYVPIINDEGVAVYYETTEKTENGDKILRLGDENLVLVSNPSNINLHTAHLNDNEIDNPLKFMCNNGYKNYINENGVEIRWSCNGEKDCVPIGKKLSEINIDGITIYAYRGNGGEIVYLTNNTNKGKLIATPKKEHFNNFYNSLDSFEKLLINPNSKPKYSALFEVISENSFGYETELKRFTFPTKDNGYNLCIGGGNFDSYVNSLLEYAEFYDETFSDNLWRSMTHEAIKNFDWSFTREYSDGDDEDYIIGGSKIQNVIRLFGREFDEIKYYIDAIKGYNQITYGNDNMLPNYYVTDVLSDEGWDVINIYPFNIERKQLKEIIYQMSELNGIQPYYNANYTYKNGYFNINGVICQPSNKTETYRIEKYCGIDVLINKIKDYINDKEYTLDEINTEFLKRLILNSRYIWRKKGTIEGIESLLALFGLKSDRFDSENFDYRISEYAIKLKNGLLDEWIDEYTMNEYDWYNSTKTVAYDTDDYRQGIYHSYQGLPIRSYIIDKGKYHRTDKLPIDIKLEGMDRYLLPYFSKNKIIDGNPYYQMNGGWLIKDYSFDKENNLITRNNTETYRDIKCVENLKELISLPMQDLRNNDVYYVNDLSERFGLVDGILYQIYEDEDGNEYIKTYISNNSVKVGYKYFADELTVSNPDGTSFKYDFSLYNNNTELRIYLYDTDKLFAVGKYYSIGSFVIFEHDGENYTNYFQLNDVQSKLRIGNNGWIQISKDNDKYKWLNSIVDKFSGNNPHTGHLSYDNGYEYISYFNQIFKYAIENEEFNERCYDNFLKTLEEKIKKASFNIGADENCEYLSNGENTEIITNKIPKEINVFNKDNLISKKENVEYESDKVINTKRVKIEFFVNKEHKFKIKFLDYVVMNYLEQMLPSTLITEIIYCSSK